MSAVGSFTEVLFLVKKEVTYNTDAAPVAGTDDFQLFEGQIALESNALVRPIDFGYYGSRPKLLTGKLARLQFGAELASVGSGSEGAAPEVARVLEMVGHAETLNASTDARYNPVSSAFDSATVWVYAESLDTDANLWKITGVRGNADFSMAIDDFPKMQITAQGTFDLPEDVTSGVPSGTFSTRDPIAIDSTTFSCSIDSFACDAVSFEIRGGQQLRRYEGAENVCQAITGREATGLVRMFDPGIAAKDFWALANARTKVNFDVQTTGGAGDIVQLVGTGTLQANALPRRVNIDGAPGIEVPFDLVPASGNDEYEVVFK